MEKIKNILFKFVLLAIMLVAFNFIYKKLFFENDLQKHSPIINVIRKVVEDKSEIVYFGESSNTTFREIDTDKRAISQMLGDYYPQRKFGTVNKEASHSGIYYDLLRAIPDSANVKTIIVTLNLRSFDASWIYSHLETALRKSMVLIKDKPPLYNRLLLSFKAYEIKSDAEREAQEKEHWKKDKLTFDHPFPYDNVADWDYAMAQKGIRNADGSKNEEQTILACHYIKTYAFQIDTCNNPRIKDFDKIVAYAKKRNLNVVLNLMAENLEKAQELVGDELSSMIKHNRDILVKRYSGQGVVVVDNLTQIKNVDFIDQNWTTEHYTETGRKLIAKNVAMALQKFYPNEFIDKNAPVLDTVKHSEFYNDCEGNTVWGQMHTLTSDKSFSGKKSSQCGQNHNFSLSFDYPVKNLPDSLKNVTVTMQLFQQEINPDVKLVIEISGEAVEYTWVGTSMSDLTKTTNKWAPVTLKYNLPSDFYKSEVIKIYAYNTTGSLIWIDDVKIVFGK